MITATQNKPMLVSACWSENGKMIINKIPGQEMKQAHFKDRFPMSGRLNCNNAAQQSHHIQE